MAKSVDHRQGKKMRIGIEALGIFKKHKHGIDISAIELIKHLQLLDHQNQYFIFCFDGNNDVVLHESKNFKIIRLPRIPGPLAEQFILPYMTYKYKLDILHSTGNTSPLFSSCRQILTLHDIICLETSANLRGGTIYQQLGNFYRRLILPFSLRKVQNLITVSNSEHEKISERIPKSALKLEVINESYGSHFTQKPIATTLNTSARYKLPKEGFIFVHGSMARHKNFTNVLKALHLLKQEGNLKLKVVISNMAAWRIKAKIRKHQLNGLEKELIITNYINNTDLPDVYNLATLFLYPSFRESFGIPILEAMACGTPVITSDCSSMPEVAGKAALLVNPESTDEIAAAINKVLTNETLREELKQLGLQQVKKFSWKRSAENVLDIYNASEEEDILRSSVQA